MKNTSVSQEPAPAAVTGAAPAAKPAPQVRKKSPVVRALSVLASLKLTVALFALSIFLVLCGSLAQIDKGNWTVVHDYFRSFCVWIPLYLPFPRAIKEGTGFLPWLLNLRFPYPGGYVLGPLLLINLLAAHLVRFKVRWKRSGILLTHSGLVLLMLGELSTGLFAVEAHMPIPTGLSANYVEENEAAELAVLAPADDATDDVVAVPARLLRQGGVIRHDALPFDVEVRKYMANSTEPQKAEAGKPNPADAGDGRFWLVAEKAEGTGVDQESRDDMPSVYVTLKDKQTGASLGTYLFSFWLSRYGTHPYQPVTVGEKIYDVALRGKRTYKPYAVHLYKFTHESYPGSDTPKNFASTVRLTDPSRGVDRQMVIKMNEPLRYQGETFYQAGVLQGDAHATGDPSAAHDEGTILQVVRNPGWQLPYVSCSMVGLGMAIHFGLSLIGFLKKRAAQ
jgi:hypothetical protein